MRTQTHQESTLRQIFPDGEIYAVSDCEWLRIAAEYYDLRGVPVEDSSKLPSDANVVLFLRTSMVSAELRKQFPGARVLVVPIASFDPSLEAALYTQKLVMHTDFVAACAQGRYWADNIASQAGPLVFTGHGAGGEEDCCGCCGGGKAGGAEGTAVGHTDLVCTFAENVSAAAWLEPAIGPGQWASVGSFCELSFSTPTTPDEPSSFNLNGTVVAAGVLAARDRHFTEAGDARIKLADDLRRELVAAAPISLRLADGVLTEVRAGGKDFTDAIREATNPQHGLRALELGIGTNFSVLPEVSWEFNSQLNEGAGPVHLGWGDGVSGAHMDFIVARCGHRFTS
jgi:hypothetical protein